MGIYADSSADEIKQLINLSDAEIVFAEDQEQIDKLLEIKGNIPQIKKVIYWDPKGLKNYADLILMSFDELEELGVRYEMQHPGLFERTVEAGTADDLAVLLLTSGTTGTLPKLVMHSHCSLLGCERLYRLVQPVHEGDMYVALTPLGWGLEQVSLATSLSTGRVINLPESPETIQEDLREIGPTMAAMLSSQVENMSSLIQARIDDATLLKRLAYRLILPIGYKRADFALANRKPNLLWKALIAFADLALFTPLRDKLGLAKTKNFINFGTVISADAARYFSALGLRPKQVYATGEMLWISTHGDNNIKLETVGPPLPGVEVKITEEGEIAVKKEARFLGYYKDAEKTSKVLVDGWYYTGDAGIIDEDGHLVLFDRMKDVMVLADGAKFSPQYIESRIRFCPYIKDAVVFGGGDRPFLTALIIIDFENVARWAARKNIAFTTFTDLSQKSQVYELIIPYIERVNKTLSRAARIRRFVNFYKELDPDEAELTRTRKLRRSFFEEHYQSLIQAIYTNQGLIPLETQIRLSDGRVKRVVTQVRIETVNHQE